MKSAKKRVASAVGKPNLVEDVRSAPSNNRGVAGKNNNAVSSDGGDLRNDINDALSTFKSTGSFAVWNTFPTALTPDLEIEGIGSIGLPLGEADATRVVAFAQPVAQPRKGTKKAKKVESPNRWWEVDASKITIQNDAWVAHVHSTILPFACKGLGLSATPDLQLSKLCIYGAGASQMHVDATPPTGAIFGTITIFLPSKYTGGEVHISPANAGKLTFRPSTFSEQHDMSAVARYLGTAQTIEPLTAGYQISLSYNLIHVTPNTPVPSLPAIDDSSRRVRRILQKWENNQYQSGSDGNTNMLAYLLKDYQGNFLYRGIAGLSSQDAHKVTSVQHVAEKLGFCVYLGNLEFVQKGFPEDSRQCRPRKRARHSYDLYDLGDLSDSDDDMGFGGDDIDDLEMEEVLESTLHMTAMVYPNGRSIGWSEFAIKEACIVQKDSFSKVLPDERRFDGIVGVRCGGSMLEHHYRRTAMILLRKENAQDFLFSVYGIPYAVEVLQNANTSEPSPELRKLADAVVKKVSPNTKDKTDVAKLAEIAVYWNDSVMWETICKNIGYDVKKVGVENFIKAITKFSFEALRPVVEESLTKTTGVVERLALLRAVSAQLPPSETSTRAWCEKERLKALQSIEKVTVEDIPAFIELMKADGVSAIMDIILPPIQKQSTTQKFWIAFVKALRAAQVASPNSSPTPGGGGKNSWSLAIRECLGSALDQWVEDCGMIALLQQHGTGYYGHYSDQSANDSIKLLDLCLSVGRPLEFKRILDYYATVSGSTAEKFDDHYDSLLPSFFKTLAKHNTAITSPPFVTFFRRIIGMYLRDILGPKATFTPAGKRGCSTTCGPCGQLSTFLSSTRAEVQWKLNKGDRLHVENQLSSLGDKVTTDIIYNTRPSTLIVKKTPKFLAEYQWAHRLAQATKILSQFGDGKTIAAIMGGAYPDMKQALSGVKGFTRTDQELAAM